jgi:hypothetical protein
LRPDRRVAAGADDRGSDVAESRKLSKRYWRTMTWHVGIVSEKIEGRLDDDCRRSSKRSAHVLIIAIALSQRSLRCE